MRRASRGPSIEAALHEQICKQIIAGWVADRQIADAVIVMRHPTRGATRTSPASSLAALTLVLHQLPEPHNGLLGALVRLDLVPELNDARVLRERVLGREAARARVQPAVEGAGYGRLGEVDAGSEAGDTEDGGHFECEKSGKARWKSAEVKVEGGA